MKILLASLALSMSSTIAMACPNLDGKFHCTNLAQPNLSASAENTQSLSNGITTYNMWQNSSEEAQYIADGVPRKATTPHGEETIVATCNDSTLIVVGNRVDAWSNPLEDFKMNLRETSVGFDIDTKVTQNGKHSYEQENKFSCIRQ